MSTAISTDLLRLAAFELAFPDLIEAVYDITGNEEMDDVEAQDAFFMTKALLEADKDLAQRMANKKVRRFDAKYLPAELASLKNAEPDLDDEQWEAMQGVFQRIAQLLGYEPTKDTQ